MYEFDSSCQKDLNEILTLKSLRFNLNEIAVLQNTKVQAEELVNNIDYTEALPCKIGVPSNFIDIMRCNNCNNTYKVLFSSVYENGFINNANLKCKCGSTLSIDNGIIMGESDFKTRYSEIELNDQDSCRKYIAESNIEFTKALYFAIKWISSNIISQDKTKYNKPRLFTEFGVGSGFFIRNYVKEFEDNDIYVAIDHDIERLKRLKLDLEKMQIQKGIVFICCDFGKAPIPKSSVDVAIDFYSSMSSALESSTPLIKIITGYLKDNAEYYGVHTIANLIGQNKVDIKNHQAFTESSIRALLSELNYEIIDTFLSDTIKDNNMKSKNFLISARKNS